MAENLTTREQERFEICTAAVLESLQKQFDGGIALIEIRDHRLYRAKYSSLEEYCQAVLKISARRAYQLMEAAEVKESLPEKASEQITNERQARALADVPENKRAKVIQVAKSNGDVTAETLKAAAKEVCTVVHTSQPAKMGKSEKPPPVFDEEGCPIPECALPFWNRKQEVQDLLTQISHIKRTIEKHRNEDDPMYARVSNTVVDHLSRAYQQVLEAKPYAVCTTCMGHFNVQPKGCSFCGDKGLISEWQWNTQSRQEVKDIRRKVAGRATA